MFFCDELEKNIKKSKKDSELLMQSVLQEAFTESDNEAGGIVLCFLFLKRCGK